PLEFPTSRVPPPLRWAIERCLAKDPAERWNSTVELVRQIRQIRDKLAEFQPPAESRAEQSHTRPRTPAPVKTQTPPTPNPPAAVAPTPLPTAKSPMPAILSAAIPLSVGSGSPIAAPTKARRVREFAFVLGLGLAFLAAGAFLGHWFRGKQIDAPAANW